MSEKHPEQPRRTRTGRAPQPDREDEGAARSDTPPTDEEGRRKIHEGTDESRGVW